MTVNTACDENSIRNVVSKDPHSIPEAFSASLNDSPGVKKKKKKLMPMVASYHGLVISCFLAHEQGLNFQGFAENGMIILHLGKPKAVASHKEPSSPDANKGSVLL